MPKEFIIRGQTASGTTEVLNMTGYRPGYGYSLTELRIWPSTAIGATHHELVASVTANNTLASPPDPNFNEDGLIGTAIFDINPGQDYPSDEHSLVNDLFIITQDLILSVQDTGGGGLPINWHVRFKEIKLSSSAEAVANYKQYTIYNTSS